MAKRRVFISYHHSGEQAVVDEFIRTYSEAYEVFTDASLSDAADSDNSEYLNEVCRQAIKGTSVTIVMIGKQTGCRKFVDWEIRYSLHVEHGLIGICRPGINDQQCCIPTRLVYNIRSGYSQWYNYPDSAATLKAMIDKAYEADKSKIENDMPKLKQNNFCP